MNDDVPKSAVQPVDRKRRFRFIAALTSFCLVTSGVFTLLSSVGLITINPVLETYVNSLMTLATAAALSYVTGSVIDYNGAVAKFMKG